MRRTCPGPCRNIKRCLMQSGIKTVTQQSRRHSDDCQLNTKVKRHYMRSRYIAIDCSTNLRAGLYHGEECVDSRQSEAGVTRLNGRSFEAVFAEITAGIEPENTPVWRLVWSGATRDGSPFRIYPTAIRSAQQLTAVGQEYLDSPWAAVLRRKIITM